MGSNTKKKNAWTLFSKFIRLRDCLATTATTEQGVCISCNREFPFNKLQAGHLIPGRYNAVLFDEELVHAQCYACNILLGGNLAEYYKAMVKRHGAAYVDQLMERKHAPTVKFTDEYLDELIDSLKIKISHIQLT